MKLAVVGSRSFKDLELMTQVLSELSDITTIVSGGARGADALAECWAKENGIEIEIYLPDWETHGKAAGHIRNRDIIGACDECVAFWDGESSGTLGSINLCKKLGKPVRVIEFS